ncbi:MAG TPA: patatin-like phospholipase family protein [Ignavibacteria bacterium]|nr:patatin-like phospholipase family protein [Ignavibacteria bacterium]
MSKLGLALGGGGARGLAHIGVLKVLDREGIKINAITGCSMGSIIGGLYAYYGSAKQVEDHIMEAIKDPTFVHLGIDKLNDKLLHPDKNYFEQLVDYVGTRLQALKSLNHLSYFDEEVTGKIYEMLPDEQIENLKIRFSAIATDLISGEEINFTKGNLRDLIRASSAIPGIFPPVNYGKYFLVDGSASEGVPAGKVREIGADRVLAVDVTRYIKVFEPSKNIFDILYRTEDITSYNLSIIRLKEADLIIRPDVRKLSWADFDQVTEIIKAGETAANENLNEIKKLVHRNSYLLGIEHYIKKFKGND